MSGREGAPSAKTPVAGPASPSLPEKASRDESLALGKLLGELEADDRGEKGELRDERIKRAMAYAAWDHDGRSLEGDHLKEFGLGVEITPSLQRTVFGQLLKKGKEKKDGSR